MAINDFFVIDDSKGVEGGSSKSKKTTVFRVPLRLSRAERKSVEAVMERDSRNDETAMDDMYGKTLPRFLIYFLQVTGKVLGPKLIPFYESLLANLPPAARKGSGSDAFLVELAGSAAYYRRVDLFDVIIKELKQRSQVVRRSTGEKHRPFSRTSFTKEKIIQWVAEGVRDRFKKLLQPNNYLVYAPPANEEDSDSSNENEENNDDGENSDSSVDFVPEDDDDDEEDEDSSDAGSMVDAESQAPQSSEEEPEPGTIMALRGGDPMTKIDQAIDANALAIITYDYGVDLDSATKAQRAALMVRPEIYTAAAQTIQRGLVHFARSSKFKLQTVRTLVVLAKEESEAVLVRKKEAAQTAAAKRKKAAAKKKDAREQEAGSSRTVPAEIVLQPHPQTPPPEETEDVEEGSVGDEEDIERGKKSRETTQELLGPISQAVSPRIRRVMEMFGDTSSSSSSSSSPSSSPKARPSVGYKQVVEEIELVALTLREDQVDATKDVLLEVARTGKVPKSNEDLLLALSLCICLGKDSLVWKDSEVELHDVYARLIQEADPSESWQTLLARLAYACAYGRRVTLFNLTMGTIESTTNLGHTCVYLRAHMLEHLLAGVADLVSTLLGIQRDDTPYTPAEGYVGYNVNDAEVMSIDGNPVGNSAVLDAYANEILSIRHFVTEPLDVNASAVLTVTPSRVKIIADRIDALLRRLGGDAAIISMTGASLREFATRMESGEIVVEIAPRFSEGASASVQNISVEPSFDEDFGERGKSSYSDRSLSETGASEAGTESEEFLSELSASLEGAEDSQEDVPSERWLTLIDQASGYTEYAILSNKLDSMVGRYVRLLGNLPSSFDLSSGEILYDLAKLAAYHRRVAHLGLLLAALFSPSRPVFPEFTLYPIIRQAVAGSIDFVTNSISGFFEPNAGELIDGNFNFPQVDNNLAETLRAISIPPRKALEDQLSQEQFLNLVFASPLHVTSCIARLADALSPLSDEGEPSISLAVLRAIRIQSVEDDMERTFPSTLIPSVVFETPAPDVPKNIPLIVPNFDPSQAEVAFDRLDSRDALRLAVHMVQTDPLLLADDLSNSRAAQRFVAVLHKVDSRDLPSLLYSAAAARRSLHVLAIVLKSIENGQAFSVATVITVAIQGLLGPMINGNTDLYTRLETYKANPNEINFSVAALSGSTRPTIDMKTADLFLAGTLSPVLQLATFDFENQEAATYVSPSFLGDAIRSYASLFASLADLPASVSLAATLLVNTQEKSLAGLRSDLDESQGPSLVDLEFITPSNVSFGGGDGETQVLIKENGEASFVAGSSSQLRREGVFETRTDAEVLDTSVDESVEKEVNPAIRSNLVRQGAVILSRIEREVERKIETGARPSAAPTAVPPSYESQDPVSSIETAALLNAIAASKVAQRAPVDSSFDDEDLPRTFYSDDSSADNPPPGGVDPRLSPIPSQEPFSPEKFALWKPPRPRSRGGVQPSSSRKRVRSPRKSPSKSPVLFLRPLKRGRNLASSSTTTPSTSVPVIPISRPLPVAPISPEPPSGSVAALVGEEVAEELRQVGPTPAKKRAADKKARKEIRALGARLNMSLSSSLDSSALDGSAAAVGTRDADVSVSRSSGWDWGIEEDPGTSSSSVVHNNSSVTEPTLEIDEDGRLSYYDPESRSGSWDPPRSTGGRAVADSTGVRIRITELLTLDIDLSDVDPGDIPQVIADSDYDAGDPAVYIAAMIDIAKAPVEDGTEFKTKAVFATLLNEFYFAALGVEDEYSLLEMKEAVIENLRPHLLAVLIDAEETLPTTASPLASPSVFRGAALRAGWRYGAVATVVEKLEDVRGELTDEDIVFATRLDTRLTMCMRMLLGDVADKETRFATVTPVGMMTLAREAAKAPLPLLHAYLSMVYHIRYGDTKDIESVLSSRRKTDDSLDFAFAFLSGVRLGPIGFRVVDSITDRDFDGVADGMRDYIAAHPNSPYLGSEVSSVHAYFLANNPAVVQAVCSLEQLNSVMQVLSVFSEHVNSHTSTQMCIRSSLSAGPSGAYGQGTEKGSLEEWVKLVAALYYVRNDTLRLEDVLRTASKEDVEFFFTLQHPRQTSMIITGGEVVRVDNLLPVEPEEYVQALVALLSSSEGDENGGDPRALLYPWANDMWLSELSGIDLVNLLGEVLEAVVMTDDMMTFVRWITTFRGGQDDPNYIEMINPYDDNVERDIQGPRRKLPVATDRRIQQRLRCFEALAKIPVATLSSTEITRRFALVATLVPAFEIDVPGWFVERYGVRGRSLLAKLINKRRVGALRHYLLKTPSVNVEPFKIDSPWVDYHLSLAAASDDLKLARVLIQVFGSRLKGVPFMSAGAIGAMGVDRTLNPYNTIDSDTNREIMQALVAPALAEAIEKEQTVAARKLFFSVSTVDLGDARVRNAIRKRAVAAKMQSKAKKRGSQKSKPSPQDDMTVFLQNLHRYVAATESTQ